MRRQKLQSFGGVYQFNYDYLISSVFLILNMILSTPLNSLGAFTTTTCIKQITFLPAKFYVNCAAGVRLLLSSYTTDSGNNQRYCK